MKIGNEDKTSNHDLCCIFCGDNKDIHLVAHRHKETQKITGFIVSCYHCHDKNVNCEFGIWDAKTGEAKI